MTPPDGCSMDQWDEIDHVIFALAGLMRHASKAQADLLPNHHCFGGYPQQLADELDRWVRRLRAGHTDLPDEQEASR